MYNSLIHYLHITHAQIYQFLFLFNNSRSIMKKVVTSIIEPMQKKVALIKENLTSKREIQIGSCYR